MSQKLSIVGAGGQARAILSVIKDLDIDCVGIYDDNYKDGEMIFGVSLLGTLKDIPKDASLVLAVGDCQKRSQLFIEYKDQIYPENIIHSSVVMGCEVHLGQSNQVLAGSIINAAARIGDNNIINTGSIIEHEAIVGSHNHISVNATLLGRCQIGNHCFIGAGAVIRDGVSVCDSVVIGANSYVSKDITEPGTYVGSSARLLK